MNRRALFLEALGIGTEWVPRHAAAVQAEAEDAPAAAQAVAPSAPELETPSHDAPGRQAPSPRAPGLDADAAVTVAPPAPRQPLIPIVADDDLATLDWQALEARVAGCTACQLCSTRTRTVFGVGDREADWMLVGEAPGENEDRQGEPFVGQAGKLLDNMLTSLQLARGRNVFIANVLKCRPPGNRNPEPAEVEQCEPFLRRQIALVRPRLIVVLGRFAAQTLLRTTTPISKLRGTVHRYEGIPVVVTYHPAYLLRTLSDKARAWEDLCLARDVYRQNDPAAPADLLDSELLDSNRVESQRAGTAGGGDAGAGH
ncbi:uracil-DNA glycosylase [Cupriavidus sp. JZ107]